MAFESRYSSSDNGTNLEKDIASELDIVPTKYTSIEPDPLLFITPEKKGLLKNFQKGDSISNSKMNRDIPSDPKLLLTPEKSSQVMKNPSRTSHDVPSNRNRVRFNLPDSSSENTTGSLSPNTQSSFNESSTLSTEFDEGSSTFSQNNSNFSTKAALYTQRNPLADITVDSYPNFDSTTITDSSTSTSSSQQSFPKIFDMKGKKLTQKKTTGALVEPKKSIKAVTKITTMKPSTGHRKISPVQAKIDKLTATQSCASSSHSPERPNNTENALYLRKKSGLHKHQHSVRYINKEKDPNPSNELESPKYNTTVATGQKLQKINEEEFDAIKAITSKIETDSDLKSMVKVKAAAGTNVDPEETLFTNLVAVDVALQDVATAPEFRRVKRPHLTKTCSNPEPNIIDAFPGDLVHEKMVLDSRCFVLPEVELTQIPLSSVMCLYEHSLSWS